MTLLLSALMLAGCGYQEETWIDFMDLSQITDGGFKVYSQKMDNLGRDGVPSDCYVPDGTPVGEYHEDTLTKATGATLR